ncbi:acetylxylan esterase [Metabacillus sp. GX 13764]|uniref:acetylxylan esterase n=1 Tax=Metabacillus kandeliae TaxID=2900151 RepID=UPI001E38A344|nr:acetylxylan esterase [Metabacillus kandeliae]MCD7034606.1 acetylxylan esterase [Metabacillus kandeliae]
MNLYDLPLSELKAYKPQQTKEQDFDSFWDARIEESAGMPLNVSAEKRDYAVPGVEVYDLYFDGFRNSRIHALYVKPLHTNAEAPAAVMFHGYNWNGFVPHHAFKYAVQGIPALLVDVRGQNLLSPDSNTYENGGSAGWMTLGIKNPDNYYYSHVYMDACRSVDVIRELSGKTAVIAEGGSQGGALTIAAAALQKDLLLACADIPYLTDFRRSVELATEGPYNEIYHYFKVHDPLHQTEELIYKTLSYVDCMNLASRISCPVMLGIGLEDNICPPSTGFALYYHLEGKKEIKVYPECAHGLSPLHEEEKLAFIASVLGETV